MKLDHEVRYDGPYLHVDLPEVLPPDWRALRRDLDPDAFVTRAFITAPRRMWPDDEVELLLIADALTGEGAEVSVIRLPDLAEQYFG
jgi:hypothetical protein